MSDAAAARERLILALDLPGVAEAEAMVARVGAQAGVLKIGLELAHGGGVALAERLAREGRAVFLDLKLHDIPQTVARATAQIARTGARYLTVHAYPQTIAAAVEAARGSALRILPVSVLTSMGNDDLARAGYGLDVESLVRRRARQAREAGAHGLICAPTDLAAVRETVGHALELVTPGIRPSGGALGDQKRVMTPGAAIRAGANRLVVGRPITGAQDPEAAAMAILEEIAAALREAPSP